MIKIIIFLANILLISFTSSIQQSNPTFYTPSLVSKGLTFQNYTGAGVTKEMLNSFIAFANFASATYQNDLVKNAKFIKFRMDDLYGKAYSGFCIIIQTDEVISSRYFWVAVDSVYATISGINKQYPKWSYLFYRVYGSKNIENYVFFGKDQIGREVTKNFLVEVKSLINVSQTTDTCTCSKESVKEISDGLQMLETGPWSVICDNKGVTSALIRNTQTYVSIRLKSCYYTIYPGI